MPCRRSARRVSPSSCQPRRKNAGWQTLTIPRKPSPPPPHCLAHEKATFGNFGLAAAAYNAGPGRVARFRDGRSGLPFETLDYVVALTGKGAATFLKPGARVEDFDLEPGKDFFTACRALPVRKTRFRNDLSAEVQRKPWGVDVAGNFKRAVALRNWEKVRARLGTVVGDTKPELVRTRSPLGPRTRMDRAFGR